MLIALLGMWLFGGGDGFSVGILSRAGIEKISERITVTVADTERRESVLNSIKALDMLVERSEKTNSDSLETLRSLYEDHSSESKQLLEVVENFDVDWQSLQNRVLDYQFEIRDSLTEEEWTQIFSVE
jgi:hypothetical protein